MLWLCFGVLDKAVYVGLVLASIWVCAVWRGWETMEECFNKLGGVGFR